MLQQKRKREQAIEFSFLARLNMSSCRVSKPESHTWWLCLGEGAGPKADARLLWRPFYFDRTASAEPPPKPSSGPAKGDLVLIPTTTSSCREHALGSRARRQRAEMGGCAGKTRRRSRSRRHSSGRDCRGDY